MHFDVNVFYNPGSCITKHFLKNLGKSFVDRKMDADYSIYLFDFNICWTMGIFWNSYATHERNGKEFHDFLLEAYRKRNSNNKYLYICSTWHKGSLNRKYCFCIRTNDFFYNILQKSHKVLDLKNSCKCFKDFFINRNIHSNIFYCTLQHPQFLSYSDSDNSVHRVCHNVFDHMLYDS